MLTNPWESWVIMLRRRLRGTLMALRLHVSDALWSRIQPVLREFNTPPASRRYSATECSSKSPCTKRIPSPLGGICPMSSATGILSATAYTAGKNTICGSGSGSDSRATRFYLTQFNLLVLMISNIELVKNDARNSRERIPEDGGAGR